MTEIDNHFIINLIPHLYNVQFLFSLNDTRAISQERMNQVKTGAMMIYLPIPNSICSSLFQLNYNENLYSI